MPFDDLNTVNRESAPLPYWVLLSNPSTTTIPIFALGVEARLPKTQILPDHKSGTASKLLSGNVLRRIINDRHAPQIVTMRRRLDERTASYSLWATYQERRHAELLLREYPHLGWSGLASALGRRLNGAREHLESGSRQRRFDLSRVGAEASVKRAKEFLSLKEREASAQASLSGLAALQLSLSKDCDWIAVG